MGTEPETATELAAEAVGPKKRGIIPVPDRLGALHDRSVGGLIGFLIGVASIHLIAPTATPVHAGLIFGASGSVGVVLGKLIPPTYREALQAVLGLVAVLVGAKYLVTP